MRWLRRRTEAESGDAGYTLVEIVTVVVIIGVMSAVAFSSVAGATRGMNNSIAQMSIQAVRVSLAAASVSYGTVPIERSGGTTTIKDIDNALVPLPSDNANFMIGYVPFCYEIISAAGIATNTTIQKGLCPDPTPTGSLREVDFVLCAKYGSTGQLYIADTWHSVQAYPDGGGTWPDGTTMDLHGCEPKSITSQGGVVEPQT